MLVRMWRKGNPVHSWWECKLVQPLWKRVYRVSLKKLKIELPYDLAIPLLDIYICVYIYMYIYIYTKKHSILKRYLHFYVPCIIFHNSQYLEAAQVSISRQKGKENVRHTHTHTEVLFSLKKEGDLAICNYLVEPGGYYAEWNKPDIER